MERQPERPMEAFEAKVGMAISWHFSGRTNSYCVTVDGKEVYSSPDRREVMLFMAELRSRLAREEVMQQAAEAPPRPPESRLTLTARNIKKYEEHLERNWTPEGKRRWPFVGILLHQSSDCTEREQMEKFHAYINRPGFQVRGETFVPATGSSKLNGSSDVFTRTRGAI